MGFITIINTLILFQAPAFESNLTRKNVHILNVIECIGYGVSLLWKWDICHIQINVVYPLTPETTKEAGGMVLAPRIVEPHYVFKPPPLNTPKIEEYVYELTSNSKKY